MGPVSNLLLSRGCSPTHRRGITDNCNGWHEQSECAPVTVGKKSCRVDFCRWFSGNNPRVWQRPFYRPRLSQRNRGELIRSPRRWSGPPRKLWRLRSLLPKPGSPQPTSHPITGPTNPLPSRSLTVLGRNQSIFAVPLQSPHHWSPASAIPSPSSAESSTASGSNLNAPAPVEFGRVLFLSTLPSIAPSSVAPRPSSRISLRTHVPDH